jgi:hypothetical protein
MDGQQHRVGDDVFILPYDVVFLVVGMSDSRQVYNGFCIVLYMFCSVLFSGVVFRMIVYLTWMH